MSRSFNRYNKTVSDSKWAVRLAWCVYFVPIVVSFTEVRVPYPHRHMHLCSPHYSYLKTHRYYMIRVSSHRNIYA